MRSSGTRSLHDHVWSKSCPDEQGDVLPIISCLKIPRRSLGKSTWNGVKSNDTVGMSGTTEQKDLRVKDEIKREASQELPSQFRWR
jgi:hypothetical protein